MKHNWVPYAAIIAGTLFLVETVDIFVEGGDKHEWLLVPAWMVAVLLALAAAIGTGLRSRPGRRILVGAGLTALLVAWIIGLGSITSPVFEAVFGDHKWVTDEGPVGLLGAVLIALGARAKITEREPAVV
jgi:drug/metabolite transporter (DMT)-like permease